MNILNHIIIYIYMYLYIHACHHNHNIIIVVFIFKFIFRVTITSYHHTISSYHDVISAHLCTVKKRKFACPQVLPLTTQCQKQSFGSSFPFGTMSHPALGTCPNGNSPSTRRSTTLFERWSRASNDSLCR